MSRDGEVVVCLGNRTGREFGQTGIRIREVAGGSSIGGAFLLEATAG